MTDGKAKAADVDWSAALAKHEAWLRRVIIARAQDPHAQEEVFQEVALAAVRQTSPLQSKEKVAPWLYRLAVLQSILYRRKKGRERKLTRQFAERQTEFRAEESDPLDWLIRGERRQLVRQALRRLPPREAEILLLKYGENVSYEDIAQRLGLTASAVESRLHRSRKRLREEIIAATSAEFAPAN